MKKGLLLALVLVFVVGIFGSAVCAAPAVKAKGDLGTDYLVHFSNQPAGNNSFKDPGSEIKVTTDAKGVLKIDYKLVKGGWMGATCEEFMEDWSDFTGLTFKVAGGTKCKVRLELRDANGVSYEYLFVDDAVKGKVVTVPFSEFKARTDWQPAGVDPEQPFSLVPAQSMNISPLDAGKGVMFFSEMKLYK